MALITKGNFAIASDPDMARLVLSLPLITMDSVGAGAGSFVRLDPYSGAIKLGPDSAGYRVGTCWPESGLETVSVSDCHVVLGYLNPENFLGGQIKLDVCDPVPHPGKSASVIAVASTPSQSWSMPSAQISDARGERAGSSSSQSSHALLPSASSSMSSHDTGWIPVRSTSTTGSSGSSDAIVSTPTPPSAPAYPTSTVTADPVGTPLGRPPASTIANPSPVATTGFVVYL